MIPILIICAVVAGVSVYDFFNTRNWQQVTSTVRNHAVFEKRNKTYGAFQIRRHYNRNLALILIGMTGGVGLIYAATNVTARKFRPAVEIPVADLDTIQIEFREKEEVKEPVIKPKNNEAQEQATTQKFTEPAVTDDKSKEEKPNIDPKNAGKEDNKGNSEFPPNPDPKPEPPGNGGGGEEPIIDVNDPQIPDVPAEFPGGMANMKPFLKDNLVYPEFALQEGRGGKVYLRFIVDKDGEISDVTVTRKAPDCTECDAEAKRVIRRMPKWTPGTKKGKPVKTYFNIPVSFNPG